MLPGLFDDLTTPAGHWYSRKQRLFFHLRRLALQGSRALGL
jgi:hypothetical protein